MDIKEKNEFNDKMLSVLKKKIFLTLVKMARKTLFRTVAIKVCKRGERWAQKTSRDLQPVSRVWGQWMENY